MRGDEATEEVKQHQKIYTRGGHSRNVKFADVGLSL